MIRPVRLGIIGCGKVAWERHYPALRGLPEFRVTAVCDLDQDRAAHVASLFGAARTFTDFRQVVGNPEIDAIAVLTPPGSHAEIGAAALLAGKHLFLEKPLALTLDEASRLIDAHNQSGKTAQLCFNLRWHRLVRKARGMVGSGLLGRLKAVRSVYTHDRTGANAPDWHRKLALGGGVGFNEAVHHYDLWRYLTGQEVVETTCLSTPSPAYEDETSVITARMGGGIVASGVFSFLTGPNSEVELFGDKGRLLISLYRFDGLQFYPTSTYPGALSDRWKRGAKSLLALPGLADDARNGGGFQSTFTGCWKSFGQALRTGSPPFCTLDDGRRALAIALAAAKSSKDGVPTQVPGFGPAARTDEGRTAG